MNRRGSVIVAVALGLIAAGCTGGTTSPPSGPTPTESTVASRTDEPVPSERAAGAAMPEPRTEVAGTTWRDGIVVGGGLLPDRSASGRVDWYDPAADSWQRLPDLPEALHHSGFADVDGELWAIGGYVTRDGQWLPTDRTWRLAAPDADWIEGPSMSVARGALAVVTAGDVVWAIGGVGPDGTHRSTELLVDGGWQPGPDLREPREHLAATAVGDDVVVIAGRDGGMSTNKVTTERIIQGEVSEGPSLQVSRGGMAAATVGGVPCVAGGETPEGTVADVECLIGDTWKTVASLSEPRHGLAVVAIGSALHVIGGGPTPGLSVSDRHEIVRMDP